VVPSLRTASLRSGKQSTAINNGQLTVNN
jgi:hypothetical protein